MRFRLLPLFLLLASVATQAQDAPVTVPSMSAADMDALPKAPHGKLVYNTDTRSFFVRDGNIWRPAAERLKPSAQAPAPAKVPAVPGPAKVSTGSTGFWDLTGNAGTTASDFLGTTDAVDLNFRVGNTPAGNIRAFVSGALLGNGHTAFGLNTGGTGFGNSNSFFGSGAGGSWYGPGNGNTLLGAGGGGGLTEGDDNTMVGQAATLKFGSFNTLVGSQASGSSDQVYTEVTLLGYSSRVSGLFTNASAIGSKAQVAADNALVLGSINGVNQATADVNVGIGTTAPLRPLHVSRGASGGTPNTNALLVVEDNANAYINLMTPDANESGMLFGTPTNNADGGLMYNQSSTPNGLAFRTNGNQTRAVIDADGQMGIGVLAPLTRLDVSGALALRRISSVAVPAGASTLTVGDASYLRVSASGSSTVNLSNGLSTGQLLLLEGAGGTVTVNDNAAVSNCNLVANRALAANDLLTLLWNGSDWIEVGFANN